MTNDISMARPRAKIIPFAAALLFFFFAAGLGVCYVLGAANNDLNSDIFDSLLWAQAAYESGSLIDPDFYYATLLPLGGHLIMIPFIAVFGFGVLAHMLGMLAFLLLFWASMLFFFRSLLWSWTEALAGSALLILMTMASEWIRHMIFGHILYYSQGMLYLFIGTGLLMRLLRQSPANEKRPRRILLLAALCLWMLVTAVNGAMTLALFSVPLIAAIFLERMLDPDFRCRERKSDLLTLALMILSTLAGYAVYALLSDGISTSYADSVTSFVPWSYWISNMQAFFQNWILLLSEPVGEFMVLSPEGLLSVFSICAAVMIFVIPWLAIRKYRQWTRTEERLPVLLCSSLTAVVAFLSIFTRYGEPTWRLTPVVLFSALLAILFLRNCLRSSPLVGRRLAALGTAVLLLFGIKCGISVGSIPIEASDTGLTDYLRENGLTYGYATYWNAIELTARSNEAVRIRPVELQGDLFPYEYQSNARWYEPQDGEQRYFLLLTKFQEADFEEIIPQEYEEMLSYGDYTVWVYEEPLF